MHQVCIKGDDPLTVGEADAEFGRFSHVRNHRRPFSVSDLVFTERQFSFSFKSR